MTREETLALLAGLRDLGIQKARLTPDGHVLSVTFGLPVAQLVEPAADLKDDDLDARLSGPFKRILEGDVS